MQNTCNHSNVNDRVDAAVVLKDGELCVLHKLLQAGDQKEIILQHHLPPDVGERGRVWLAGGISASCAASPTAPNRFEKTLP